MTYSSQYLVMEFQPSVAISHSASIIRSLKKNSLDTNSKQSLFYHDLLRKEFNENKQKWLEDTLFSSNADEITSHPSYLRIIEMGENVLLFIFKDLDTNMNHWFAALEKITGENPVSPQDSGDIRKMREVWLNLAERNLWYLK